MYPKVTTGRAVHFQSYNENGEFAYASIVTQVKDENEGVVDLVTFGPNSVYFQHDVPFSAEGPKAKHWNWPPKV